MKRISKTISDVIAEFGDVEVAFTGYFKYCFTFKGKTNVPGVSVVLNVGGDPDDIYCFHVTTEPLPISCLEVGGFECVVLDENADD